MAGHVLISGASVAGPALAHWLHRFGFTVTVVERSPGLRPGGQAVDLRGVAKDVVRRMGLDEAVRAARTQTLGMSVVSRRNRRIVTISADDLGGDGLIAEIEILRGDLAQVLYDATRDSVEYLFGEQVVELREDATGVVVGLSGGAERRFDLVVGADGLHSGVRALVFGRSGDPVHHLGHYLAFFTVPNRLGLDRWALSYIEPGRSATVRSIRDNRAAMALLGFRSPPLHLDPRDVAGQQEALRARLAGMAWEVPWLLEQMDAAADFYLDACAQVVLDRWSSGRVGLLGDAAFCPSPLSGQGTSLALVGAYVLAVELAACPGEPAAAFAGYERRMRRFVAANQEIGRKNARRTAPPTRRGVALQHAALLAMTRLPGAPWVMRRMMRAINEIDLPDHPAVRAVDRG